MNFAFPRLDVAPRTRRAVRAGISGILTVAALAAVATGAAGSAAPGPADGVELVALSDQRNVAPEWPMWAEAVDGWGCRIDFRNCRAANDTTTPPTPVEYSTGFEQAGIVCGRGNFYKATIQPSARYLTFVTRWVPKQSVSERIPETARECSFGD